MVHDAWRRVVADRELVAAVDQIRPDLIKLKAILATTTFELNNKAMMINELSQKLRTAKAFVQNKYNTMEAE